MIVFTSDAMRSRQDNKNTYYTSDAFNDHVMKLIKVIAKERLDTHALEAANSALKDSLEFMLDEVHCISSSDADNSDDDNDDFTANIDTFLS